MFQLTRDFSTLPRSPQSKDEVERAIKTMKMILKKADKCDSYELQKQNGYSLVTEHGSEIENQSPLTP